MLTAEDEGVELGAGDVLGGVDGDLRRSGARAGERRRGRVEAGQSAQRRMSSAAATSGVRASGTPSENS